MRIGVISDTHDNLPAIERAVTFFNTQKISFVLHAGDYVAPFAAARLASLSCGWRGVFGNNDGEKSGLIRISEGRITEGILRVEIGGRKIAVVHDLGSLDPEKEKARIIVCGHTHKPELATRNSRLIVNPGEACGWLSGVSTVAIVDLETLSAKIHTLERSKR
ncbi:MAG: metallophosphoesterase [Candidatus Omnitrophota bacterium]